MNEDEINKILQDIYLGIIQLGFLPISLYLFTSNKLLSGVYTGYGYTLTELYQKGADMKMLRNLATNIYHFSAAKTFQNVYDLQSFIYDKNGFKVSFAEFEKQARTVFDTYNKKWLETEYNSASMSASAASQWEGFLKNAGSAPLLKYQTAHDERVRKSHAIMDGIVRPINDSFWSYYFPPNGWGCRCDVVQLSKGEADLTPMSPEMRKDIKDSVPEVFRNNPGQSEKIFADHHPYFDVPAKYQELKSKNFNLPIPI